MVGTAWISGVWCWVWLSDVLLTGISLTGKVGLLVSFPGLRLSAVSFPGVRVSAVSFPGLRVSAVSFPGLGVSAVSFVGVELSGTSVFGGTGFMVD